MRSLFSSQSNLGMRALIFVILSIALMVMDKHMANLANLRSSLSLPVAPLRYVVNLPAQLIDKFTTVVRTHESLVRENAILKADRLRLNVRLQRFNAIESENNYLKSLLQSSRKVQGKTLIAELLAVASEPFLNQVTLDKGKTDGVYVGQPVLDAHGVMGQIIEAGPVTSRVMLINDTRSGIAVQNVRSGIRAVAAGDNYSDRLRLMYVPKTADIRIGDLFLTSGLGDHYPEGYPVGKVVMVNKDPARQFAEIYLQPSAHIDTSRQVLLIWYQQHA
ncbi:MAG TPA: rod shape-determining protein MreC [Gammaproteobacteria bacterium]|nr:rod shape-determining protein MreC [Gammaproteobacteria bacterium]